MSQLDLDALQNLLMAATLALPRTMVCLALVPLFQSGGAVPRTLRIGIALGLSLPACVGVAESVPGSWTHVPVLALALKEAALGLFMGIVLACPFWAIETAGALLDNQRGENAGQQATPFSEGNASLMGSALKQVLVIYLGATGGVSLFYQLLLTSYEAWPVLSLMPGFLKGDGTQILQRFNEMVRLGILFSAPFVLVLVVIDFGFALLGVAATNLQTYFAAMPVKSLGGLFVLLVYLERLLDHGDGYFRHAIEFLQSVFATMPVR